MVAGVLAVIWIGVGIAALVLGLTNHLWVLVGLGPVVVWYGLIWIRVARQGRKLRLSETFRPWKRS